MVRGVSDCAHLCLMRPLCLCRSRQVLQMNSFSLLVALGALGAVTATDGLSMTVLTAQYRCEGYLCPQWAIDITRCAFRAL